MFQDQSFDAPVIHVVSESPRLEMLQARLRQAGIRPVPVRGTYLPPDSAPAFVDLVTREFAFPEEDKRVFVTIGKQSQAPGKSEIHLTDIAQIATLPARLAIRQRETHRLREVQLRARTSEKFGSAPATLPSATGARLLWLGHDAPFLNAIKADLAEQDINLVAAISRLTAEDYLYSGSFETLVLCPSHVGDEAAKLLASIKSLDLVQAPQVILLLRPELATELPKADLAQADQIVDLSDDVDAVSQHLLDICAQPSLMIMPRHGLAALAQDTATGLVSRDYLESHVEAQMAQADRLAAPLSLVAVDIRDQSDLKCVSRTIQSLLRDTDLAARLDPNHICITLPNTHYRGAVILARRIESALNGPITWRVIERRQFHTLNTLIGGLTAPAKLGSRKRA